MAMALSRTPATPPAPPPNASDAIAARALAERLSWAAGNPGGAGFWASWSELASGAKLAGRAWGIERVMLRGDAKAAHARLSKPLPLGFWLNLEGHARLAQGGTLALSGRAGRVPLPGPVIEGALGLARWIMAWRGVDLPPPSEMVSRVNMTASGATAIIKLPDATQLRAALGRMSPRAVDRDAVVFHYCRLNMLQRETRESLLEAHVRRVFGEKVPAADTAESNRAALVALAMFVVSPRAGQLAGVEPAMVAPCRGADTAPLLLGRADLAKHWTLSAALAVSLGPGIAEAMGGWKELADSAPGGSGYSFVDLAADRSGLRMGAMAASAATADRIAGHLLNAREGQLLPKSVLDLNEGMSEAEFERAYRSPESGTYRAMIRRIDAELARADKR